MKAKWAALVFAVASFGGAQQIQFAALPQDVIEARLKTFSTKNTERERTIRSLFLEAGCTEEAISSVRVEHIKEPDIVCTRPGESDAAIAVDAHFDMVDVGSGVVDNWSGASLLPSLYQGLAVTPRKHTFIFIAFTGEEKGLLGSKEYVRQLGRDKSRIKAMINMDTLGLTDTEVWVSRADPKLVNLMSSVAGYLKLPVSAMNVEKVGSSDSESFRNAHIPAMTIHSLTQSTLRILHSPNDQIKEIHLDAYYRTYQLVLGYLAILDQKWE